MKYWNGNCKIWNLLDWVGFLLFQYQESNFDIHSKWFDQFIFFISNLDKTIFLFYKSYQVNYLISRINWYFYHVLFSNIFWNRLVLALFGNQNVWIAFLFYSPPKIFNI